MGNNSGTPVAVGKLKNLFTEIVTGECRKAETFKNEASIALKVFRVSITSVAFVDDKGVLKIAGGLKGTDREHGTKSLNSMAMLKDEFIYFEKEGEEIFLFPNNLGARGLEFSFLVAVLLVAENGSNTGTTCLVGKSHENLSNLNKAY